jgi:hypothetical protein
VKARPVPVRPLKAPAATPPAAERKAIPTLPPVAQGKPR